LLVKRSDDVTQESGTEYMLFNESGQRLSKRKQRIKQLYSVLPEYPFLAKRFFQWGMIRAGVPFLMERFIATWNGMSWTALADYTLNGDLRRYGFDSSLLAKRLYCQYEWFLKVP